MIVNTAQGEGGGAKLNLYCQPSLPTDKFDGICLLTNPARQLQKVIFDTNPYAADGVISEDSMAPRPERAMAYSFCACNGELWSFADSNNGNSYAYNPNTNTWRAVAYNGNYENVYNSNVAVGTTIYSICLNNDYMYIYNTLTQTYIIVTGLASLDYQTNSSSTIFYYNGYIYSVQLGGNALHRYSVSNGATDTVMLNKGIASSKTQALAVVGNLLYDFCDTHVYIFNLQTLSFVTSYNLPIDSLWVASACAVGTSIYFMYCNSNNAKIISKFDTNTNTIVWTNNGIYEAYAMSYFNNVVYCLCYGTSKLRRISIASKTYNYSPAMVISRWSKDTAFETVIVNERDITGMSYGIPFTFHDAVLYENGTVSYPSLFVGNGSAWSQIR